ncbi:MAG: hypothetical protein IPK79_07010 [Vampirovibrionales bacterium]|nr:hypothetical protein [Vampirovibrionales bacterium]
MAPPPFLKPSRVGSDKWMLALFPLITLACFAAALVALWVIHFILSVWR